MTAEDSFNNATPGYTGTVHFTTSDAAGTFPVNNTTLTSGSGTFNATFKTGGVQTLTATDTTTVSITASTPVTVTAGATTHFLVTGSPSSVTAGGAVIFTVTAEDSNNNTATGYNGTVHFTSTDGLATLPADTTLTNGVADFSVILKTAGVQTLTATDDTNNTLVGTSNPITVAAGAATHFTVSAPTTATAGVNFSFTVTALDSFGNTATGYNGTVKFTTTDAKGTVPTNTTLSAGTGVLAATLKTAGVQTITATDSVTSSITATSNPITVNANVATHFVVTSPSPVVSGQSFNFTVTADDSLGNVATGYTGTVHISLSDAVSGVVVPANNTLTNGTGTFSATFITAGSQTITATDTVSSGINGSTAVSVSTVNLASHFVITAPSTTPAGSAFTFTVTAENASNAVVPTYSGTVHFTTSDSRGTFTVNNVTLTSGTGTFSATLDTAGMQTITGTDTVNTALLGTSNEITVTPDAATHYKVTAPAAATPGTPITFTVTAEDSLNNTATGYTGTVQFTSSDAAASLPANSPLTNGVGTFTATFNTGGVQSLTATDTTTSSITGAADVTVSTAATHFLVSAPTTATAGSAFTFTVTAEDSGNNTAAGYTGTVHFTTTDAQGAFTVNNVTLTNGTGTFTSTLKTTGAQTITATDTVSTSIVGTSNAITVAPAATTHFVVTAPSQETSGTPFTFTVTAEDQFNNIATNYAGDLVISSTDPNATLPATKGLTNGVGTFTTTLKTTGVQTLTATDTSTSSINGTSNAITVSASVATHFVVTAPTGVTLGTPFTFTVTAEDSNNNVATGYTGTVHFSSSDTAATLPANSTLVNGTETFTGTFGTAGLQTLTATDTVSTSITGESTVTVNAAITISTITRSRWTVGEPNFPGTLTITGGTGTYTITSQSGLPTGLTAVVSGSTISFTGTPTSAQDFTTGSITVKDSAGATATQTFGIDIVTAPTLGALSQTQWTANNAGYSGTIAVNNGTTPFTLGTVTGLPTGLTATLSGSTITIAGTPTVAGTFSNISVTVTDAAGATVTQTYSITINPPLALSPTSLPGGTVGTAYSQTIDATGGTGAVTLTYSVSGTVPAGLTISPASPATGDFSITGTPTAAGSFTITVTATDSTGATTTTTYTVNIASGTSSRQRWVP